MIEVHSIGLDQRMHHARGAKCACWLDRGLGTSLAMRTGVMRRLGQKRPSKSEPKSEPKRTAPTSFTVLLPHMQGAAPEPVVHPRRRRGRPWFLSALLFVLPALFAFASVTVGYSLFTHGWGRVARFSASLISFAI